MASAFSNVPFYGIQRELILTRCQCIAREVINNTRFSPPSEIREAVGEAVILLSRATLITKNTVRAFQTKFRDLYAQASRGKCNCSKLLCILLEIDPEKEIRIADLVRIAETLDNIDSEICLDTFRKAMSKKGSDSSSDSDNEDTDPKASGKTK